MIPTSIDGTDITGATIDGTDVTEITVDGQTVFTAPPNVIGVLQHFATTWSQGDTIWVDDTGNQDMSLFSTPQAATLPDGSDAISFDGVNDYGETTPFSALEGNSLQSFSIEFAFSLSSTNVETLLKRQDGEFDQSLQITLNVDENFNSDNGNAFIRIQDQNANDMRFSFDTNPGLNDGSRKDFSVIFDDTTTNSVTLIVNGTQYTPNFSVSGGPNSFTSWPGELYWFAEPVADRRYFSGSVGAIRWSDSAISSQTIGNYP